MTSYEGDVFGVPLEGTGAVVGDSSDCGIAQNEDPPATVATAAAATSAPGVETNGNIDGGVTNLRDTSYKAAVAAVGTDVSY
jgi:hypothetical protein